MAFPVFFYAYLKLGGVDMKAQYLAPAVTVFDNNGNVDEQGCCRLYDHLISGGIDGIVVMGSTGEFFEMTMDEIKRLIDISTQHCKGRTRLLIGTSRMIADETIELGNYAVEKGAHGVMIISPYYFQLSDESIEYYYDLVCDGIKGDIYLYNYPDITGHQINYDVVLRLLKKHKNLKGIKDTTALVSHTRDLINNILPEYPDFEIYNGFDENFAYVALSGGAGVIGGLSNLIPDIFSKWVKAVNSGDAEGIAQGQKVIDKAMEIYAINKPFIPAIKRALNLRGININEYVKPPFLPINDKQEEKLISIMKDIGIL